MVIVEKGQLASHHARALAQLIDHFPVIGDVVGRERRWHLAHRGRRRHVMGVGVGHDLWLVIAIEQVSWRWR